MANNVRPESMARIVNAELAEAFIAEQVAAVREQVGDKKVLLALSGGVDSSVSAVLRYGVPTNFFVIRQLIIGL